jgi:lysophospholipase L1-like esterase
LVIIAFGTNEGFDDGLDLRAYRAAFAAQVSALQEAAPQSAILVLGAPDGARIEDSGAPQEPRNLAAVRRIQQEIAAERGWPFWDWTAAMGGAGSMARFVRRDPPWALADHMHLNRLGYTATADKLFSDLMADYEEWKSGREELRCRSR